MGKSTISMVIFNSYVSHNQRVCWWKSHKNHPAQFIPLKSCHGDGSKPWYLVNPKIAGKWMFIPLKMVSIGIDPYPHQSHDVPWSPATSVLPLAAVAAQSVPRHCAAPRWAAPTGPGLGQSGEHGEKSHGNLWNSYETWGNYGENLWKS